MIIAEVKSSQFCRDDYSVFLTFEFNQDIINTIKDYPERYWIPEEKCWELPIKYFNRFKYGPYSNIIKVIDDDGILEKEEMKQQNKHRTDIPANYSFKTKPYKHQLDGILYGLNHDNFLLGDEQGLGKTMQVINIACIKKQLYNYKHCLIICGVNGLKWNWQAEVEKHSNERGYILGTRIKNDKTIIGTVDDRICDLQKLWEDPNSFSYFIITNVETLRNGIIQTLLKDLCEANIIDMIAFDEFHKVKDPGSQQGKAILKLHAKNMIAMTGTPLMNSPIDLYVSLKWLGIEDHNFYAFKNHYCIMRWFWWVSNSGLS